MMSLIPHATPLELVFFVVSIAVLLLSVWTLREASLDLAALTASRIDGNLRATAQSNTRESIFSFIGALITVFAASLAMMLEPPPPEYTQLPQSLVFLVAFIALGLKSVMNDILSLSTRKMLMSQSQRTYDVSGYTTESQDDEDKHEGPAVVTAGRRGDEPRVETPSEPHSGRTSDRERDPHAGRTSERRPSVTPPPPVSVAAAAIAVAAEAKGAKVLAEKTVEAAEATLDKLCDPENGDKPC